MPTQRGPSRRRCPVGQRLAALVLLIGGCASPAAVWAQGAPQRYALLIGLNQYRHLREGIVELKFSENDVNELGAALRAQGFRVMPLVNERATRADILEELYKFAEIVQPQDTFLLYFAGHGVRNRDRTYWLTYDTRLSPLDSAGIRLEHLLDYLQDIKASKRLLLLDHCFSGDVVVTAAAAAATPSLDATRPSGGGSRAPEGGIEIRARGIEAVPGWTQPLQSRASGMLVLAASRGLAFESAKRSHGLFTLALLTALTSRSADANKDGKLTASELLGYMPGRLKALAAEEKINSQQVQDFVNAQAIADWEIASSLPVDDASEAQNKFTAYRAVLIRWARDPMVIEVTNKLRAQLALEAWVRSFGEAGTPLGPVETLILSTVRAHIDDARAPEDRRARSLNETITSICQDNKDANICK